MALSDIEVEETFRKLSDKARSSGLGWVLNEVSVRIAYGQPVPIKESELRSSLRRDFPYFEVRRGTRGPESPKQLTRIVPFTPSERLGLLVHALSHAVVDTHMIAREVVAFAGRHQKAHVSFESEQEPDSRLTLSEAQVDSGADAVGRFKSLLAELLEELNAP